MIRSKSFYKSTPNLFSSSSASSRPGSRSRPPPTSSLATNSITGRDELEERYLDLRDAHLELRREAAHAQAEIRQLHVKLTRLIDEKKRYFHHRKSDREVALEEAIADLEQELVSRTRQNDRLKDRIQLLRIGGGDSKATPTTAAAASTTTNHVRVSSAYAHVQSRTDSGLQYQNPSYRHHHHHPSLELRPKSGILKNPLPQPETTATPTTTAKQLPLTATMLMAEAKDEIIRLETIIAEQQSMLDTLLGSEEDQEESQGATPTTTTASTTISYQLTTTTTASLSGTQSQPKSSPGGPNPGRRKSSTGLVFQQSSNGFSPEDSSASLDLWTKYQQLMARQETTQRLSADIRTLIESLYRAVRDERQRVAELERQLIAKRDLTHVIAEKDKLIETLRKENGILQSSMAQCVSQVMNPPPPQDRNQNAETIIQRETQIREAYQNELLELRRRLTSAEANLVAERSRAQASEARHQSLTQLSEADQLHIRHLEAKVGRLSDLVFSGGGGGGSGRGSAMVNGERNRSSKIAKSPQEENPQEAAADLYNGESAQSPSSSDTSSSQSSIILARGESRITESSSKIADELDQILASLPHHHSK